jgi:hypothetical protein
MYYSNANKTTHLILSLALAFWLRAYRISITAAAESLGYQELGCQSSARLLAAKSGILVPSFGHTWFWCHLKKGEGCRGCKTNIYIYVLCT